MATPDWTAPFLDTVAQQIRWKAARPVVLQELNDHLEDQCTACLDAGMTLQDARAESLLQMGDPAAVGRHLDAVHRPKNAKEIWGLLAAFLVLNLLIWLLVFFDGDWSKWLWTPLLAMGLGTAAMVAGYFLPWNRLLKQIGVWSFIGLVCLIPILQFSTLGNSRSSDYIVYLLPMFYICLLYPLRNHGVHGYLLHLLLLGVLYWLSVNLFVFLGTLIFSVTALTAGILVVRHGAFRFNKGKYGWMVLPHGLFWVAYFGKLFRQYTPDRDLPQHFTAYFRRMLAHARLIGPGSSFRTVLYRQEILVSPREPSMPLAEECDFFLTTVIYRCGWLVGLGLVAAVAGFLVYCLCKGLKQPSLWGNLLSCTIVLPMLLQTTLHTTNNLFGMIASAQLPLLSYGNTYRILDLALLGLLLSILRNRTILRDTPMKIA